MKNKTLLIVGLMLVAFYFIYQAAVKKSYNSGAQDYASFYGLY